jgi:hypothetical protein
VLAYLVFHLIRRRGLGSQTMTHLSKHNR